MSISISISANCQQDLKQLGEYGITRKPEFEVSDLILNRWSSKAMSGQAITDEELFSLFEAARWAPSAFNNQPWRFIYAKRETPEWQKLFNPLVDFHKQWVKNAAALVVVVSKDNYELNGKPCRTHSFEAGAAWENLALQGSLSNLVVVCLSGFDYDQVKEELKIPDGYTLEVMGAIGRPGKKEDLPITLQSREIPSTRKPLQQFVFQGSFKDE